ncbi:MAG: response regulator [Verrucomicrobia bacterium]|nr:response regulator [Verrucomicrobiota bacterium]
MTSSSQCQEPASAGDQQSSVPPAESPPPPPHAEEPDWVRLFRSSPVGQYVCSRADLRCVEVNDSFLRLAGLDRQQVLGRADADLPLWPHRRARDSWWLLAREKTSVREVELALRTSAGEQRTVVASADLIRFQAEPCVLWTVYDLTERSSRELHVRQAQKLEAITKLAAGFAHDFNNLLCVVQGHASLLQSDPALNAGCAASVRQISTAAERGASLTRQLLTFSRKQILKPKTVDLNFVIHGMSDMLLRVLGNAIVLHLDFSADAPVIQADTGMLEQVIMNLVMNARDAMRQGGQLTLGTAAFTVDAPYVHLQPDAYPGRFARLSVADTGCGLEPGAVERLFEPFFTTKDVGTGSGLGLATVYGIVKQHRGWIEVASRPGRGTTFKIYLPASQAPAEAPAPKPAPFAAVGGNERIFLVEDEPGLLPVVQNILQHYGYEVVTATSGVHALDVWQTLGGRVDLLITDVVMPRGMTGCELAGTLRGMRPDLKVIYTSGYSADLVGPSHEELVEGFNFIQKPYRPHALAQTVRCRLDGPPPSRSAPVAADPDGPGAQEKIVPA